MNRSGVRGLMLAALALVATSALALQKDSDGSRHHDRKSQSEAASKSQFPTIVESSPEFKKALKAGDFEGARKLIGKEGAFQGTVVKVFSPAGNVVNLLNFDKNFRNALVAAVKPEDYGKFPDLQTLVDKRVLVKGKFVDYRGVPELSVTEAGAIKIVKSSDK